MKTTKLFRTKGSLTLLLSGASLFGLGSCLPENYFGDLLLSLTTNTANLVAETVATSALESLGLDVPAPEIILQP